ncbi:MAG: hypothetical protein ACYTG5_15145 [Planctomycetota bacterium]
MPETGDERSRSWRPKPLGMDPCRESLAIEVESSQNHAVHAELHLKIKVQGRHPWFYRKMIKRPAKPIRAGSPVRVVDREGKFVGCGFYNGRTEKALRILDHAEVPDPEALLLERLKLAIDYRDKLLRLPRQANAYRPGSLALHAAEIGGPGRIPARTIPGIAPRPHR